MSPVARVLWRIERDLGAPVTLGDLADDAGLSRHHLCRAFVAAVGQPPMRYLRRRRLSEAARRLARGETDILGLAFDYDYGSHEAFTRAFRAQFGQPPEALRRSGRVDPTLVQEPVMLVAADLPELAPPRFEDRPAMTVAGLTERIAKSELSTISGLWSRFAPHIGHVAGERPGYAYGVCAACDDPEFFSYTAGVEIDPRSPDTPGLARVGLAPRRYAVFLFDGHVSEINRTFRAIFEVWAPSAPCRLADAPDFERYGNRFDPVTGSGEVEIFVPVAAD